MPEQSATDQGNDSDDSGPSNAENPLPGPENQGESSSSSSSSSKSSSMGPTCHVLGAKVR